MASMRSVRPLTPAIDCASHYIGAQRRAFRGREEVTLKLMVGPGDVGEPVITIMLPNED